jgi:hypothetical protein
LFSWSQGTRSLISGMRAGHLDDILRSTPQTAWLSDLVKLDRAAAQGFDILMQAVSTCLRSLRAIISSSSCDAHHPAVDLVASWGGSNTEPQPVVPEASV